MYKKANYKGNDYCPDCVYYIAEQANELTKLLEEKHVDA